MSIAMIRNMNIATKINLALGACLIVLLGIGVLVLTSWLRNVLESRQIADLEKTNAIVVNLVGAYNESLEKAAEQLAAALALEFDGAFSLSETIDAETAAPVLRLNERPLNGDHSLLDRFTDGTGVTGTLFVRQGDDFIHIATSLRQTDGSRAGGSLRTSLGMDAGAVDRLLQGENFSGKTRLFGRDYMSHYHPIRDSAGRIIAVLSVGVDFTEGMLALKSHVRSIKVGESGYMFALNDSSNRGMLEIHPAEEGSVVLDSKDADGREFIKEMLNMRHGVIRYPWKNAALGETRAREKVAVVGYFEEWQWVIASSGYTEEFSREAVGLRNQVLLGSLLVIVTVLILVILISRHWVARPLSHLMNVMGRVAQGDLTTQIDTKGRDEVAVLASATRDMQEKLRAIVAEVNANAMKINAAAQQINGAVESQAAVSSEMSSSVAEITSTMEELSASSTQIAEHSSTVVGNANETLDGTRKGSEAMQIVLGHMQGIQTDNQHNLEEIVALGAKSKQISKVMEIINTLADQTKLIAFNAALEASSAGESGKRFSVVAGEIRRLADSVTESTGEIEAKIVEIQDSISRLVITSEKGASGISTGLAASANTAERLNEIVKAATQTSNAAQQISMSTQQQKTASNQVVVALREIVTASAQTAQSIGRISQVSKEMTVLSARLDELVHQFTLDDRSSGIG